MNPLQNDQYYDLDDGFIDDGDNPSNGIDEEAINTEMLQANADSETRNPTQDRLQQKEELKVLAKFKVMSPTEVQQLLEDND